MKIAIAKVIDLADKLDSAGLTAEADRIDAILSFAFADLDDKSKDKLQKLKADPGMLAKVKDLFSDMSMSDIIKLVEVLAMVL